MRDRAREVEALRRRAVRSWNADRVGACALVIMTFAEYLALVTPKPTPAPSRRQIAAGMRAALGRRRRRIAR
jgi:hypothetical protein